MPLNVEFPKDYFVQSLKLSALASDVTPNEVDVEEQFGESILYGVGLTLFFIAVCVHDDVYSFRDKGNVNVGVSHYRVAIIVNHAGFRAMNVNVLF